MPVEFKCFSVSKTKLQTNGNPVEIRLLSQFQFPIGKISCSALKIKD